MLWLSLLVQPVLAQQFPTYWYWQVADSSPSSQVWEATSGSFVSSTSTNFKTWLALVAANPPTGALGLVQTICNVTNNGSGADRVTICPGQPGTGGWATNQYKTVTGVGGATAANGAWIITVIDQFTIDLQGSTFGSSYTSGGVIGAGSPMDTAQNMYSFINRFNVQQYGVNQAIASLPQISTTTVLTNPIPGIVNIAMMTGGQSVTLPQANLFNGYPIGYPITFINASSNSWALKDSAGASITVPPNYSLVMYLVGNQSAEGSYLSFLSPSSQLACGDLSNSTANCSAAVGQLPGTATNDNAASGRVGEYISSSCPSAATTATVTITIAAPGVITWTAHGFTSACPVVFTNSGGALPTGITSGTTYWVVPSSITTNTFQIATSLANALAGTSITTSGSQSGTQTGTAGAPLSTATPANVTGVALTAGDWDCRASLARNLAASTSITLLKSSINTTSATDGAIKAGTMDQYATAANVAANDNTRIVGPTRISLSGAGNVYLVADDTFSVSTNIGYGFLACRRAR